MSGTWPEGLAYRPGLLDPDEARAALESLLEEVEWEEHHFTIFGRTVPMPRRIQMYGPHGYHYSGVAHPARPLSPTLERLRLRVEQATGLAFNSVLCNLYRDGNDSMGWHRDNDYPHGGQPVVASLSLGAARRFRLKPRKGKGSALGLDLGPGSLLLIGGEARTSWVHSLPRTARPVGVRVNLTFRHMAGP